MSLEVTMLRRYVALLAVVCGCSTTVMEPGQPNGTWSASSIWLGQVVITRDTDAPQWPADPVTIVSAEVLGDSLELTVSYGGGCREHTFLLLSDGAWMESYPVQVGVRLAHDARGDMCRAFLTRLLKFDLSPLKAAYNTSYQSTSGIIRLNIRGSTSVTYTW